MYPCVRLECLRSCRRDSIVELPDLTSGHGCTLETESVCLVQYIRRSQLVRGALAFVGVLVESSKGVYLIIPNVGDGRIDETGRLGADGRDHLGLVAVDGGSAVPRRAG